MVRYVRVLKIEKRYEPARGALLIKTMIDTNNFYSSLNLRDFIHLIPEKLLTNLTPYICALFIFWCFVVTWTVYFGLDAHFVRGNHLYRFGYKKASKIGFCWCDYDEMKVHVESFQNPVLECFYDLWLWFYASLKFWEKG